MARYRGLTVDIDQFEVHAWWNDGELLPEGPLDPVADAFRALLETTADECDLAEAMAGHLGARQVQVSNTGTGVRGIWSN